MPDQKPLEYDEGHLRGLHERVRDLSEKHLVRSLRPRWWFSRMTIFLQVLALMVAMTLEPRSLTYQAIDVTGAWWVAYVVIACSMVGIADVLVNDVCMGTCTLKWAVAWRHVALLGMAIGLATLSVMVSWVYGFTSIVLVYWLNCVLAACMTFMDAFARYPRSVAHGPA